MEESQAREIVASARDVVVSQASKYTMPRLYMGVLQRKAFRRLNGRPEKDVSDYFMGHKVLWTTDQDQVLVVDGYQESLTESMKKLSSFAGHGKYQIKERIVEFAIEEQFESRLCPTAPKKWVVRYDVVGDFELVYKEFKNVKQRDPSRVVRMVSLIKEVLTIQEEVEDVTDGY